MAKELKCKLKKFNYEEDFLNEYNRFRTIHNYCRYYSCMQIPPPPIPGNEYIKPLSTTLELVQWGLDQHNCLASLIYDIILGRKYFYKINFGGETATIEIKTEPKVCGVEMIRGPYNMMSSISVVGIVTDWYVNFLQTNKKTA